MTYCRPPDDTEQDMLDQFNRIIGRNPEPWDDIDTARPPPTEADRLEVRALEESLAEIDTIICEMPLDDPDASRWLQLAADMQRDLAAARAAGREE